jgi:hypothetical protein
MIYLPALGQSVCEQRLPTLCFEAAAHKERIEDTMECLASAAHDMALAEP